MRHSRTDRTGPRDHPCPLSPLLRHAAKPCPAGSGSAGPVHQRAGGTHPCAACGGGYRGRAAAHAAGVQRRTVRPCVQRRAVQHPRAAGGAGGTGTPLHGAQRHRGAAARLRRVGRVLCGASQRHLCLCGVGGQGKNAVSGPRPLRRQAAVFCAGGKQSDFRQRAENAALSPGGAAAGGQKRSGGDSSAWPGPHAGQRCVPQREGTAARPMRRV